MDLRLTPEEQAFRDEARDWLTAHHPGPEPPGEEAFEFRRSWQRTMHEAGWAAISWPKEYGGRGASLIEQAIFREEMARAQAPPPANILGLLMGGPVLIAHGTKEQQERYLDPIASGEEIWCQGFSEPEAGSDLAALKTRAVRDGDQWVVTGQKVWTSFAHRSKWCMLLARTDAQAPKHRGLTFFLMDMEQPAVQVRPLRQITGESEFNELFIEEARIPAGNVIGQVDDGWRVALDTLSHERAGLGASSAITAKIELGELARLAAERGVADDSLIRQRFAQLYADAEALRLIGWRGLTRQMRTGVPGPEGSLLKWQWAELNQGLTELAADVRGAEAAVADSPWSYRLLRARANSIEGGTTEILQNIIAERVLGLPRAAR